MTVAYDRTIPRRRSVFSGLLLILLGALFLLRNFHYGFPIWRIMERWWPLLFIIWGVSKLYDRMVAQRTGEAAPATISGGEVALVILLFFVIGGAGLVDWGNSHSGRGVLLPWEDSFTFPEESPAVTVPANAQISIRADHGDVNVIADDTPQIRVSTRKTAYGSNQNEAQEQAGHAHVTVNQTGTSYVVEPQETNGEGKPIRTDMEVHVPKGATLNVTADDGGVQITGANGAVTIANHHGDVEVRQAGGDVSVDAADNVSIAGAGGDVRISGHADHIEISDVKGSATTQGTFDSLRFEHVDKGVRFISNRTDLTVSQLNGRMELEGGGDLTLSDATGNVSLITKNRDITFENVSGRIHIENTSGGVSLRFAHPPTEPIDISNRSGEISVELPAKAAFDIDARSDNGEIETEFDDAGKVTTFQGNAVLVDSIGFKGPKIQLRTTYGTIHVRKAQ